MDASRCCRKITGFQQFLEARSDGAKMSCGGKLLLAGGTNLLNEIVQTVGSVIFVSIPR